MSAETITLKLDGKQISVTKGATLLDAAREAGVEMSSAITRRPHPTVSAEFAWWMWITGASCSRLAWQSVKRILE